MRRRRNFLLIGRLVISHLLVAGVAFQSGVAVSSTASCNKIQHDTKSSSSGSTFFEATTVSKINSGDPTVPSALKKDDVIRDLEGSSKIQIPLLEQAHQQRSNPHQPNNSKVPLQVTSSLQFQAENFDMEMSSSKNFVHGVVWTKQTSFQKFYDLGYALERLPGRKNNDPNQHVLLLYLDPSARPEDYKAKFDLFRTIPNAQLATENCQELQVVIVKPSSTKFEKEMGGHQKCLAVMPHWGPDRHVHRFSRQQEKADDKEGAESNPFTSTIATISSPRRTNNRDLGGYSSRISNRIPQMEYVSHTHRTINNEAYHWNKQYAPKLAKEAWLHFANYVQHYEAALEELKPILARVSSNSAAQSSFGSKMSNNKESKGVIIVMITNVARIQFLINFVCAAKAIEMDLSNLLVFCLDSASYQVAEALELNQNAYYNQDLFGPITSNGILEETGTFGDMRFSRIMIAKVYSVHLVNALGFDVLFMDSDVIPLQPEIVDYFADRWLSEKKDIYLQYDKNARLEQAPFSANSGCYFVKHNWRTQYFFETMVRMEDLILRVRSHQQVMIYLMSQFQSLVGLKVKVLGGYGENDKLFPNGWFYYNDKEFIDRLKEGTEHPYIFHANWNSSGKEKKSQLQKINLWFVRNDDDDDADEQCSVQIRDDDGQKTKDTFKKNAGEKGGPPSPPPPSLFTIPSTLTKENCCSVRS